MHDGVQHLMNDPTILTLPQHLRDQFHHQATRFIDEAAATLFTHQDAWLHIPLLLDALAGPDAQSLAAALLARLAGRLEPHTLLCTFHDGDLANLRRHPLCEHLESVAANQPSNFAQHYLALHAHARCVHSQATESVFSAFRAILQDQQRAARLAPERIQAALLHTENAPTPFRGRTTTATLRQFGQHTVSTATDDALAAARQQQREQRQRQHEAMQNNFLRRHR
jgi:hypothetical protein